MKSIIATSILFSLFVSFLEAAKDPSHVGRPHFFRKSFGGYEQICRPGKSNATKISTVKVDEEFECAQEAIFKAVEKTEKAVFGAVQDEVKLIFCPPGDFHYNKRAPCKNTETGNAVKVAISSPSKATLTKGCLEQPDITSRNECIKELLTGNFE